MTVDGAVTFPEATGQITCVDGGIRPLWGGSGWPVLLGLRLASTQPLTRDVHILGIRLLTFPAR